MKRIMNKNTILGLVIGVLISVVGVYAANNWNAGQIDFTTDKNRNVKNVADALDDLYNNNLPYVEGIWSKSAQTINYSYTVEEDGLYIVDASVVTNNPTVNTTGEIIGEYKHNFGKLRIIKAKKDDTISISGSNNQQAAGGYIVKIKNIEIDELLDSSYNSDTTVNSSYTATNDNEKVLIIAFSTGRDRSETINFSGKFKSSFYHKDNCYISTAILSKGTRVDASAYGYLFSTEQVYIFKLK